MTASFTLTYDYLCPFARIANEAVIEAVRAGADYDVRFSPFSLAQNSHAKGESDVWHRSLEEDLGAGVLCLLWSLAVRDEQPDRFEAFHLGVFSARHDDGADVSDPAILEKVATHAGVDVDAVIASLGTGRPAKTLQNEHVGLVEDHGVFGVPTFIAGREAVFVRLMERHQLEDLDHVIRMLGMANVNEFKRTRVRR